MTDGLRPRRVPGHPRQPESKPQQEEDYINGAECAKAEFVPSEDELTHQEREQPDGCVQLEGDAQTVLPTLVNCEPADHQSGDNVDRHSPKKHAGHRMDSGRYDVMPSTQSYAQQV